jgi:hypothetical protein
MSSREPVPRARGTRQDGGGRGLADTVNMSMSSSAHELPELPSSFIRPATERRQGLARGVQRRGSVVALHQRPTIALGGLGERALVSGQRQVQAVDARHTTCWVDAAGVWSDGESELPRQISSIGLSSGTDWDVALISGISDRLGWEAAKAWEDGLDLPAAPFLDDLTPDNLELLDGRLGHQVPTVVAVSETSVRWGAGATWEIARGRAMFGYWTFEKSELAVIDAILAGSRLGIAAVDVSSAALSANKISRVSVQLTSHDAG